ncbi:hypothetical protein Q5H93_20865 [Hymenobacter sp. ASUV-10]|uniref:Lipoprotein n=1 Tax=Hymenobacter aranciens TaxID=3063996 RepID=A0ABT9BKN0_9BACT|nr:hypothetical protein [Hymenobacter sp. ASUV-10]MDO7877211.1 hypothetical protein [Hymenobacter sp. ASUV-10]
MKRFAHPLHLLACLLPLAFAVALTSCSDDSDDSPTPSADTIGEVSATLNGDGFTNYAFSQTASRAGAPDGEGVFASARQFTLCAVNSAKASEDGQNYWGVIVQGPAAPVTRAWENSLNLDYSRNTIYLNVVRNGETLKYVCFLAAGTPAGGQTTITKYGANKGRIEGTFSGTLYNNATRVPLTVTNGKFWVTRTSTDVQ